MKLFQKFKEDKSSIEAGRLISVQNHQPQTQEEGKEQMNDDPGPFDDKVNSDNSQPCEIDIHAQKREETQNSVQEPPIPTPADVGRRKRRDSYFS